MSYSWVEEGKKGEGGTGGGAEEEEVMLLRSIPGCTTSPDALPWVSLTCAFPSSSVHTAESPDERSNSKTLATLHLMASPYHYN